MSTEIERTPIACSLNNTAAFMYNGNCAAKLISDKRTGQMWVRIWRGAGEHRTSEHERAILIRRRAK